MKTLKILLAVICVTCLTNCAAVLSGSSLATGPEKEDPKTSGNFDPEAVPDSGPTASEGSVMAPMPGEFESSALDFKPTPAPVTSSTNMDRGVLTLPPGTAYGNRTIEFKFDYIVDKFWASFVPETSPGKIPVVNVRKPSKTIKFVLKPTPKDKPYIMNFGYDIDTWAVDLEGKMIGSVYCRVIDSGVGPWVEYTKGNTEANNGGNYNFNLYVP